MRDISNRRRLALTIAIACFALLATDFAMLPKASRCKRWVLDQSIGYRRRQNIGVQLFAPIVVVATPGEGDYEVADGMNPGLLDPVPDGSHSFVFMPSYTPLRRGWWASTWVSDGFLTVASDVPGDARSAVESYVRDRSGEGWPYDAMWRMIEDHPRKGRVIWRGYVHNAVASAALVGFFASAWIFAASSRSTARVRRGRCHRCKYDVRELADGVCPECGAPIVRAST